MIEQAMIFSLGFLVAGVLTLLFLPAYGRRAMRLSRRRLEMQLPLSMDEIVAERDQLRAEHALSQRKVEQRAEALELRSAEQMRTIAERTMTIAGLESQVAEARREIEALQGEVARAVEDRNTAQGELAALGKELWDATGLVERRTGDLAEMRKAHDELGLVAEQRRSMIAALETRIESLAAHREDLARDLEKTRAALGESRDNAGRHAQERDSARTDLLAMRSERDGLADRLQRQLERVAELEEEVRSQRNALARHADAGEEKRREVEAAEERARVLRASLDRQSELLRSHEKDFEQRFEDLRQQNLVLKSALDTARREYQDLRLELGSLRAGRANFDPALDAGEAPLLRKAISDVGAEVLRLAAALEAGKAGEAEAESRVGELQDAGSRGS